MNRQARRRATAQARMECPSLDLRAGRIGLPVCGTTDWGPDGKALGVWGVTKPLRYIQFAEDGTARPLTRAEERLAVRVYGPIW